MSNAKKVVTKNEVKPAKPKKKISNGKPKTSAKVLKKAISKSNVVSSLKSDEIKTLKSKIKDLTFELKNKSKDLAKANKVIARVSKAVQ